ncbi:MAG: DNA cytosine methyltransferase [Elusimicrobia bacterium]|nr:DNA cytosine methyltransferase [Elusimicrobiota bacterium]
MDAEHMVGLTVRRELTALDLFCGLGGASQAMVEAGWRVVRVDIDRRTTADVVCDVAALALRPYPVDLLWASLPCDKFSRYGQPGLYPGEPDPPLDLAYAVRAIIDAWRPSNWVVENVLASRRWLCPIFGPVRASDRGHAYWGTVPMFPLVPSRKKSIGQQRGEWLRKLKRGYIPYEVSAAVRNYVSAQRGLEDEEVAGGR